MTQLTFPSAAFPAFPAVVADVPDDWQAVSVPGTVMATAAPEVAGEFRPNVVVSITRFAAGYALGTAEEAVAQRFAGFEQAHEIGRDRSEIGGREWAHIESTFVDPRVGTVVQAAHLAVVENGPVVDLVQVTGTVSAAQAKAGVLDVVRGIQRSITATV